MAPRPSGASWHFYLRRYRHYGKGTALFTVLRIADLQRVDLGIALCHFELVARECGLDGSWLVRDPGLPLPGRDTEYVATWVEESSSGRTRSEALETALAASDPSAPRPPPVVSICHRACRPSDLCHRSRPIASLVDMETQGRLLASRDRPALLLEIPALYH